MNMYIDFTLNSDGNIDGINDFIVNGAPVSGQGTYPLVETFIKVLKGHQNPEVNWVFWKFENGEGKLHIKLSTNPFSTKLETELVDYDPNEDEERVLDRKSYHLEGTLFYHSLDEDDRNPFFEKENED